MRKLIKIRKKYLIFREQAQNIKRAVLKKLKERDVSLVFLDFSQVHFVSRSFADELLKIITGFQEKNKKIIITNENLFVSRLFKKIKQRKKIIEGKLRSI